MVWQVNLHPKVQKALPKLPKRIKDVFALLVKEMRVSGPVRGDWANYGKLGKGRHHCHIKKGQPTYVAVWQEVDGTIQLIEVTYVGTHEKAPY
jgi:mRNA-degrading endonuclease RelE of RelBE toxin-antitoxin system